MKENKIVNISVGEKKPRRFHDNIKNENFEEICKGRCDHTWDGDSIDVDDSTLNELKLSVECNACGAICELYGKWKLSGRDIPPYHQRILTTEEAGDVLFSMMAGKYQRRMEEE
jgi:hypothetical protein